MKAVKVACCVLGIAAACSARAQTTAPPERLLIAHPALGPIIDRAEKARFGLFPFYSADDFVEAHFSRALRPDSAITLRAQLSGGREVARPFSEAEFLAVGRSITQRLNELSSAQSATTPARTVPPDNGVTPELPGRRYTVELRSGSTFSGILRTANDQELEFETADLGVLKVQRANVKSLSLLYGKQNFFDIGNGNRIFFAPTGRGLRKGEGSAQVISLFLAGVNYGINRYLSVGGYMSLFPGASITNQLFILTPKVTLPLSEGFGLGAGVLYANIPTFGLARNGRDSYGAGIIYGAGTYGSADNNFTAGIGYGFFEGDIGTTPLLQFGGQTRLTRRFSLLSENYLITETGMAGLYGFKLNWSRTSFGAAAAYALSFSAANDVGSSTGFIPVYYDFTYRFGTMK